LQDSPPAALLVAEASQALDAGLTAGFPQKVAANALGIAQRELELAPALSQAELARLFSLLGRGGDLAELNAALCLAVRNGDIAFSNEGLISHLILSAIAKLAVDQPGYPGFKALARR
jgi:hypothetical protein